MTDSRAPTPSDETILREGSDSEVRLLLEQKSQGLTEEEALLLLGNPNATWAVLKTVVDDKSLTSTHKIQVELVKNRATPNATAMRLLPLHYWKELLDLTLSARVLPLVRRTAEKHLRERLQGMGLGEKITLARRAPLALIQDLSSSNQLKVIQALLENPRMTSTRVQVIANRSSTPPDILSLIAQTPRWASHYLVKMALVKNGSTPLGIAMGFLSSLKRTDLHGLSRNPQVNPAIRIASGKLLKAR